MSGLHSEPEVQCYAGDFGANASGSNRCGMVEADLRGWLPVVETALESYVTSDGTVAFDMSAHIATGTKA